MNRCRSIAISISLCFLLWIGLAADAQPSTRTIELRPIPGSDVILHSLELTIDQDGRRLLRGRVEHHSPPPPQLYQEEIGFFLFVDPISGAYWSVKRSSHPGRVAGTDGDLTEEILLAGDFLLQPDQEPIEPDSSSELAGGPGQTPDGFNCTEERWSKIKTLDPAFVDLTYTRTYLKWVHDTCTDEVTPLSTDGGCWAAHPSALGTHWFVDRCVGKLSHDGFSNMRKDTWGNFHNYDFGSDDQITEVSSNANVVAQGSFIYTDFTYFDSGEGSSLIYGSFESGGGRLSCVGYYR